MPENISPTEIKFYDALEAARQEAGAPSGYQIQRLIRELCRAGASTPEGRSPTANRSPNLVEKLPDVPEQTIRGWISRKFLPRGENELFAVITVLRWKSHRRTQDGQLASFTLSAEEKEVWRSLWREAQGGQGARKQRARAAGSNDASLDDPSEETPPLATAGTEGSGGTAGQPPAGMGAGIAPTAFLDAPPSAPRSSASEGSRAMATERREERGAKGSAVVDDQRPAGDDQEGASSLASQPASGGATSPPPRTGPPTNDGQPDGSRGHARHPRRRSRSWRLRLRRRGILTIGVFVLILAIASTLLGVAAYRRDSSSATGRVGTEPAVDLVGGKCMKVTADDVRVFVAANGDETWTKWTRDTRYWVDPDAGVQNRDRTTLRSGRHGWVTNNPKHASPADDC
ncbi:hypothetical protein [Phytohabitans houttuyneae]|uniref:Uncharacterized protein n=1 Tax=Phytohabitans houttuyneae TaxID=1076126 RepID=A0A6V8KSW8_9ACTN|nr:hypothetical protein [Phytohabitans houttuyneae]GFJ84936.1 hypothetical protein Phou_091160 [Phytohabitans houttuyneae]